MPHTPASVEKELRKLCKSKSLEFRTRAITGASGLLIWGEKGLPSLIVIDPAHGAVIDTADHELLHYRFRKDIQVWGSELEEAIIEALEDRIVRYINRSEKRVNWWRNAITKRLP